MLDPVLTEEKKEVTVIGEMAVLHSSGNKAHFFFSEVIFFFQSHGL